VNTRIIKIFFASARFVRALHVLRHLCLSTGKVPTLCRGRGILAAALFLPFFLFSCLDIDTEIIIRPNLTGEVLIKYSISQAAINIGRIDRQSNFLPLPIEEQRYRDLAANVDGLKLLSFRKEERRGEVIITARYEFSNIDALNAVLSNNDAKIEIERRGERTYFTQKIINNNRAVSEETRELAKALFGGRYVNLRLTVPGNIHTVNLGTAAGNRAFVSYELPQLLESTGAVVWEVSW